MNQEPRGYELHEDPRADDGGMDAVSPHYVEGWYTYQEEARRKFHKTTRPEDCLICNPDINGEETKEGFEG
jgi:hypothetical protein